MDVTDVVAVVVPEVVAVEVIEELPVVSIVVENDEDIVVVAVDEIEVVTVVKSHLVYTPSRECSSARFNIVADSAHFILFEVVSFKNPFALHWIVPYSASPLKSATIWLR